MSNSAGPSYFYDKACSVRDNCLLLEELAKGSETLKDYAAPLQFLRAQFDVLLKDAQVTLSEHIAKRVQYRGRRPGGAADRRDAMLRRS